MTRNESAKFAPGPAKRCEEQGATARNERRGIALAEPGMLASILLFVLLAFLTIAAPLVSGDGLIVPSEAFGAGLPLDLVKDAALVALFYLLTKISTAEIRSGFSTLQETFARREAELVELSTTDVLTGVHNRRYFDEALSREWARAGRLDDSLTIALVDLDRFKTINDEHGHEAGDECLLLVAAVLKEELRYPGTVVARYGGDEFAVLMPNMTEIGCRNVLESVRARIERLQKTPAARLSISVGAAGCRPTGEQSPKGLVRLADERLYDAKRAGRNQVCAGGIG
jgi:diguanylate cyclase (GGDEF)-like protein